MSDPTFSDRLALAACPVSMAQSNPTTATPMSNPKPPEWDELSQDTLIFFTLKHDHPRALLPGSPLWG
jgi:hypothetical protein